MPHNNTMSGKICVEAWVGKAKLNCYPTIMLSPVSLLVLEHAPVSLLALEHAPGWEPYAVIIWQVENFSRTTWANLTRSTLVQC